jgi:hypothetical protein
MTKRQIADYFIKAAGVKNEVTKEKIRTRFALKSKGILENAHEAVVEGKVTAAQAIHILAGIILN